MLHSLVWLIPLLPLLAAGWIGLSAPLCRPVVRLLGGPGARGLLR